MIRHVFNLKKKLAELPYCEYNFSCSRDSNKVFLREGVPNFLGFQKGIPREKSLGKMMAI